jgi:hypothetical protein
VPRKEPKRKANFFDAAKEDKPSRRKRLAMEEAEHEAAILRGGSIARPNPRAEGKAREAAKQLNTSARKAARSGAKNAAATAFNAAKTLIKAAGAGVDAGVMGLAERGREKARDINLRAKAAAKAHPPSHKLLPSRGGGVGGNSLFKLKGHTDEGSFALFITQASTVVETDEDAEDEAEDEAAEDEARACGGGGGGGGSCGGGSYFSVGSDGAWP